MIELSDAAARLRVLTDLDSTLLVEAAAGTGKTALIAARVVMLLARGTEPRSIAAITFTELAASEVTARVYRYVDELLAGRVPQPLRPALPDGLETAQRHNLSVAADKLEGLTTATIHALCQTIITSYAVEADIDPGARILDAVQAQIAFDGVFERWLRRRLSGLARPGDPIGALSRNDPRGVVALLQELARFRLRYRDATTLRADLTGRPDVDLLDAVAEFQRWFAAQTDEPQTRRLVEELETLANFYAGGFEQPPDFPLLWKLAHPPRLGCMRGGVRGKTFDLLTPKLKAAWQKIAGKDRGHQLNEEAIQHFERVDRYYRTLLGRIGTALMAGLSDELDEVLDDYAKFKREAAILDFDDLLERARALVRGNDSVRRALGRRWRHIFVDEFQDTDPVQAEILFLMTAEETAPRWQDCVPRAGALLLVGDPKQAIYRFRGADAESYKDARVVVERQWPENVVHVTSNFRSRPSILVHINRCFEKPLSGEGQPGYVALTATLADPEHDWPSAARLCIDVPPRSKSDEIRDAEAEAVADLCARLIGNLQIRDNDGAVSALTPGGIALVAPTGTELWRYERAMEERGLPIASQAGKNLFRRQEVQDLIALARTLADAGDSLAFGALMRGPLVGLTEEELLDIAGALPEDPEMPHAMPRFSLLTTAEEVAHPVARRVLSILQDLRRQSRRTTPALLLAEAVERLAVAAILTARDGARNVRALANLDAFVERARPYGVSGLKKFVRDITKDWRQGTATSEGRVDAEGNAIEIITIHSAKGLEWPVVVPINTITGRRPRDKFVHRGSDNTLHWIVGDIVPPELDSALQSDEQSLARERERQWYVACTRARELLIIPEMAQADSKSWARIVDVAPGSLPQFEPTSLKPVSRSAPLDAPNTQTRAAFAAEQASIEAAATPLVWVRPSDQDTDRVPMIEAIAGDSGEAPEAEMPIGAGRVRGLLLHKLMEEVLTGELREDLSEFQTRAHTLIRELTNATREQRDLPEVHEIAETTWRTLQLPDVAALRPHLIPEWPVYGLIADRQTPTALAGRIDAVALEDGQASVVIDWKSDIAPTDEDIRAHAVQLEDYLRLVSAPRGALVYMTLGLVRWIHLH